jgi:uncharacterized protein
MKVLIPDIPKEGLDVEVQETIESESVPSPVKARLRIEKVGAEVMVKGDLTVEMKLQCSRCLKEFHRTLSLPVDVVYHPVEELTGEERHEVTSEELDTDFYSGEELDLLNVLKEQIVLNATMKPLCDDYCKGICSGCGADLNTETCKCSLRSVDPRMAGLKKLLEQ